MIDLFYKITKSICLVDDEERVSYKPNINNKKV